MTDIASLDEAIAKHAKWKHFLRQAVITGESEWSVAAIAQDHQCEFGHWLSGLPQLEKQGEDWRKVNKLHGELHAAAAEVLELALAGRQTEASERLAIGSNFTKISSELVMAISAWKKTITTRS